MVHFEDEIGGLVFMLGLSSLVTFYYSFHFLRRTRLVEDTPTAKVRSAQQGYVELEGIVHPLTGTALISPLSQTECVWWFYQVERHVRKNNETRWETVDRKISETPFYLQDKTGRCVVNPAGAEVFAAIQRLWHGTSSWPDTGKPTGLASTKGSYRFTEHLIKPGTRLYALGLFKTESAVMDEAGEKAALDALLAEWERDSARRQQLDADHDSHIDAKEWEAARAVALQELRNVRHIEAAEGLHTLSAPSMKNQPYLLSTTPQKQMSKNWRRYAGLNFTWSLLSGALFISLVYVHDIFGWFAD